MCLCENLNFPNKAEQWENDEHDKTNYPFILISCCKLINDVVYIIKDKVNVTNAETKLWKTEK